jgi:hypothetical protein
MICISMYTHIFLLLMLVCGHECTDHKERTTDSTDDDTFYYFEIILIFTFAFLTAFLLCIACTYAVVECLI